MCGARNCETCCLQCVNVRLWSIAARNKCALGWSRCDTGQVYGWVTFSRLVSALCLMTLVLSDRYFSPFSVLSLSPSLFSSLIKCSPKLRVFPRQCVQSYISRRHYYQHCGHVIFRVGERTFTLKQFAWDESVRSVHVIKNHFFYWRVRGALPPCVRGVVLRHIWKLCHLPCQILGFSRRKVRRWRPSGIFRRLSTWWWKR